MYKFLVLMIVVAFNANAFAGALYGERLCKKQGYHCITAKRGDYWEKLFPNAEQRDLVKRLNRTNVNIYAGMKIAVPNNLSSASLMDIAPFPHKIPALGSNKVIVNQRELAWGAYDATGNLVKWGPMSGGQNYCADVKRGCKTVSGEYTFYRKQGAGCISTKYPIGKGGAKMPYCMFFHGGYALHGSYAVPGYHASHGCVRIYPQDAEWLNLNFVRVGSTRISILPR
ncbi:MAG: L,D-transpeptidase [Gammaproteobacteria bacterium]